MRLTSTNEIPPSTSNRQRLTRACYPCIKAKRKCSLGFPNCSRCLERGMLCQYENQPLSEQRPGGAIQQSRPKATVHADILPTKLIQSMPTLGTIIYSLPLPPATADARTMTFLDNELRSHIINFSQHGKTTFIHPDSPHSFLLMHVRSLMIASASDQITGQLEKSEGIPTSYLSLVSRIMKALMEALATAFGYEDLLAITQVLILLQILARFVLPFNLLPIPQQQAIDSSLRLLKGMTHKLWETAPRYLSSDFSAHEAYALSESIRRTLIMSREVQSIHSVRTRGWFQPEIFGACLPLDRRFSLWDATASEYDAAIDTSFQTNGAQELVTYRELMEMYDRNEITSFDGTFERILVVGGKSVGAVESKFNIQFI